MIPHRRRPPSPPHRTISLCFSVALCLLERRFRIGLLGQNCVYIFFFCKDKSNTVKMKKKNETTEDEQRNAAAAPPPVMADARHARTRRHVAVRFLCCTILS
ncbi:hypothetical protein GDO81_007935 [Engystomops pustulosus]|uniref:Secreted protein n=1 Tax=Engystomops pustulosus TaxID=76066 RepID=A0AAV7CAT9_ENGPU|nr:hypothetical protein GDO81_007935 [Engystomops pustulosus]